MITFRRFLMFEYLVNKPNYCHMSSTLNYNTLESKATSRIGRVVVVSLATFDCAAGSGERGRADSSNDWGDGNLMRNIVNWSLATNIMKQFAAG